jgi:hypothetical protein
MLVFPNVFVRSPHGFLCLPDSINDQNLWLVLLLLHMKLRHRETLPASYSRYKSGFADGDVLPTYSGRILVPTGPDIVRRIAAFEILHWDGVEDFVDQEITIV